MDEILARAIEFLEDEHKAMHWLTTPNRALGGVVPMALLDSPEGKEEVLTILGRIEYGVYS
jgi:putative toxin-antitoxin system antitoxin component (TIGR02293 family)